MKVITIAGNLGKSCEVRPYEGREFITFSVAVTEGRKDNQKTIWFGCTSNNTKIAPYLQKGTKVVVNGSLTIDEKGERTYYNIRCSEIKFWNDKKITDDNKSENSENSGNTNQDFDDEIPF